MILLVNSMLQQHIDEIRTELGEEVIIRKDIQEIDDEMAQADIMVGFGPTLRNLTPEMIDQLESLKWIHADTAGVEALPFKKLVERKIPVTNTRGIQGGQMSEQIIGMMLSFTRGLHFNYRHQLYSRWDRSYPVQELFNRTLCIIGAGNIGKELARKAKVFDMRVIGIKRTVEELENFDRVENTDLLAEVLEVSDYVVLLTPYTPKTYHLIGDNELKAMKSTAVLLNFSRGEIIDEPALIDALTKQEIGGAGLDVFQEEPLPENNPLWGIDNVIISPHNAGLASDQSRRKLGLFKETYRAFKENRMLKFAVDPVEMY